MLVARVKVVERRKHDRVRDDRRHLDAQPPTRPVVGMPQARLDVVDVGENLHTTLVIGSPLRSQIEAARGAHEQLDAEHGLEALHQRCRAGARNPERLRGTGKAVGVDDAYEGLHRHDAIHHGRLSWGSRGAMEHIARLVLVEHTNAVHRTVGVTSVAGFGMRAMNPLLASR